MPKTKTYRQFREEKAEEAARVAAAGGSATSISIESGAAMYNSMVQDQRHGANGINGHGIMPGSPIAHRSAHQRTHSHPDPIRDIDMTD